jgi:hypothetical protein
MTSEVDQALGLKTRDFKGDLMGRQSSGTLVETLMRRYSDAYTEANTVVVIGKVIKGVSVLVFVLMIAVILAVQLAGQDSHRNSNEMLSPGMFAGVGFILAIILSLPIYILGLLVSAQGQTALASLDTAVNSSRHLSDDEIKAIILKRFSL